MTRVPKLVSAAALAVAVVHVAFPDVTIDAVTLALLGVAALPWLAPVLKSITLPGGFEVVLQDLAVVKERVEEGNRRVEDLASTVQELLFKGEPIAPERRDEISAAVADFRAFLSRSGLHAPESNPTVRIDSTTELPYYVGGDEQEIVIHPDTPVADTYRLYAHDVLGAEYADRDWSIERMGLQYGLAYYFASSYEHAPPVFDKSFGKIALKSAVTEASRTPDTPHAMKAGAGWALTFWRLRELASQDADRALGSAWATPIGRRGRFDRAFLRQLLKELESAGATEAASTFRGVLGKEGIAP